MDKLNIILPVYNEQKTIKSVLTEWTKELQRQLLMYRIIVMEDGSTDGTDKLLLKIKSDYRLILNQKSSRRGYAQAVIDGINLSGNSYILCIDSDGQCDPKDFSKFWQNRHNADVIIGWRTKRADPFYRKIFSFFYKLLFVLLFSGKINDPSCPFVLFKKKHVENFIPKLTELKEGFWWGFTGLAIKSNLKMLQIPINHRKRMMGNTNVYQLNKIAEIAIRNIEALIKLRFLQI